MADTWHRNENNGNTCYQVCFYSHHSFIYFNILKWPGSWNTLTWNKFNLLLCSAVQDTSHLYTTVRPLLPANCTHKSLSVMNASVEMAAMELNSFRNLTVLKEKFFWSPNTKPGYEQSKAHIQGSSDVSRVSGLLPLQLFTCPSALRLLNHGFHIDACSTFRPHREEEKLRTYQEIGTSRIPWILRLTERAVSCVHAHRLPRPPVTQSKAASIRGQRMDIRRGTCSILLHKAKNRSSTREWCRQETILDHHVEEAIKQISPFHR